MNKQPNLRYERAKPMTDEQYDDFHKTAQEEYGLVAKHEAALMKGASTLMLASQVEPFYSITYEDYISKANIRNQENFINLAIMENLNEVKDNRNKAAGNAGSSLSTPDGEADISITNLLLPRVSNVDWVEHKRLGMVKGHLDKLMSPDIDTIEKNREVGYLKHLGASSLVDYLPEK